MNKPYDETKPLKTKRLFINTMNNFKFLFSKWTREDKTFKAVTIHIPFCIISIHYPY